MKSFSDALLGSLSAWQNGWAEDQARRVGLAIPLQRAAAMLPPRFRAVSKPCFRKRFIHTGELFALIMKDERDEGITSWTTDPVFAERFKGKIRDGAVSAAIFSHMPTSAEIILNVEALWADGEFVADAEEFRNRDSESTAALFNFRDLQGEVILSAPLRGSEIIALTGVSSPFDDLCDLAEFPEEGRNELFRKMVVDGKYTGEPQYTPPGGARNAMARTYRNFADRLKAIGYLLPLTQDPYTDSSA